MKSPEIQLRDFFDKSSVHDAWLLEAPKYIENFMIAKGLIVTINYNSVCYINGTKGNVKTRITLCGGGPVQVLRKTYAYDPSLYADKLGLFEIGGHGHLFSGNILQGLLPDSLDILNSKLLLIPGLLDRRLIFMFVFMAEAAF